MRDNELMWCVFCLWIHEEMSSKVKIKATTVSEDLTQFPPNDSRFFTSLLMYRVFYEFLLMLSHSFLFYEIDVPFPGWSKMVLFMAQWSQPCGAKRTQCPKSIGQFPWVVGAAVMMYKLS